MKFLPHLILLLLILVGLVVGAAAYVDGGGTAKTHPKYSTMLVGSDRAVQDRAISVFGWFTAMLILMLFTSVLLLGIHKSKPANGLLVTFAFGFLICVGGFGQMWLSYQEYGRTFIGDDSVSMSDHRVKLSDKGVDQKNKDAVLNEKKITRGESKRDVSIERTGRPIQLVGPFPPPTTWMLFGVAFAPLTFMFIYMVGFHRWLGDAKPLQGSTK